MNQYELAIPTGLHLEHVYIYMAQARPCYSAEAVVSVLSVPEASWGVDAMQS